MKLNLADTRLTRVTCRKSKRTLFSFLFFSIFSITLSYAQGGEEKEWKKDPGAASISAAYAITLDNTQPLQEHYRADISHLSFADKEAAKSFFRQLNDPAWTIKLAWGEKNIYVILRPNELTRTWSVDHWSQQLQQKAQQL
ncbi:MAG: hypothetical protein AAGA85_25195 [Bacteroidota bacterium]